MNRERVLIMGAAGRDFHNFNVFFRNNERYEVVAFTATQIPDIEGRQYPSELAGGLYPEGIPIWSEDRLVSLISELRVDTVVFAYSDVSHEYVMHKASIVNAAGADFVLMGATRTMLKSTKPVIAICASRTGCGKSQSTRRVCQLLKARGRKLVVVRHPMPYGDLRKQRCQRFAAFEDLDRHQCSIEEREEYEPHIVAGNVVYAGVDYEEILRQAEREADIILWDGGNNDLSFFKPDLLIVVIDPHRPGHETRYHPGETNLRSADVVILNKIDTAHPDDVLATRENISRLAPRAVLIEAASPIFVEGSDRIRGQSVLVVEDGPTLTHGEMTYGAGVLAAQKFGARTIVDPRPYTVGTIAETFRIYPRIGTLLPAMGYSGQQLRDLAETIRRTPCDLVVIGTPIDLRRVIDLDKPALRVRYELQEIGKPTLDDVLAGY